MTMEQELKEEILKTLNRIILKYDLTKYEQECLCWAITKTHKTIELRKENEEITKEHALVILENMKYRKDNYDLVRQIEELKEQLEDKYWESLNKRDKE